MSVAETAGLSYLALKMKSGFLLFGGFAIFGGISKVLVEHNKEDGWVRLFLDMLKFSFIALPVGVISSSVVFDMYGNVMLSGGVATLSGAASANIIKWAANEGFQTFLNRFTGK